MGLIAVATHFDGTTAILGSLQGTFLQCQGLVHMCGLPLSNNVAELHGAAWGCALLLACARLWPFARLLLHLDNQVAISAASASSVDMALAPLARLVAALTFCCEGAGKFEVRHLRAHTGHPWNEAADNIAKATAHASTLNLLGDESALFQIYFDSIGRVVSPAEWSPLILHQRGTRRPSRSVLPDVCF